MLRSLGVVIFEPSADEPNRISLRQRTQASMSDLREYAPEIRHLLTRSQVEDKPHSSSSSPMHTSYGR